MISALHFDGLNDIGNAVEVCDDLILREWNTIEFKRAILIG